MTLRGHCGGAGPWQVLFTCNSKIPKIHSIQDDLQLPIQLWSLWLFNRRYAALHKNNVQSSLGPESPQAQLFESSLPLNIPKASGPAVPNPVAQRKPNRNGEQGPSF